MLVDIPLKHRGTAGGPVRAVDEDPRRPDRTGTVVLKLAADGLTNKQIAAELHISPKTVGVHLSQAYRKLQVPNRLQASNVYRSAQADPQPGDGDTD